jgi:hypothetical protein
MLKEHDDKYKTSEYIKQEYGDTVRVVILENRTAGPADTVYKIIKALNLKDEEILIKDCDSFFDHEYREGNYVCVSDIQHHEILKRLAAKSFIISNNQGIITSIIEKQVVSNKFCVGGYKFESAELFQTAFENLSNANVKEIFVLWLLKPTKFKPNEDLFIYRFIVFLRHNLCANFINGFGKRQQKRTNSWCQC